MRQPAIVVSPPHAFHDGYPVFRVTYTNPRDSPCTAQYLEPGANVRVDGVMYTRGGYVFSCMGCYDLKRGETFRFGLDLSDFSKPCDFPTTPPAKCGGLRLNPGPHRIIIMTNGNTSREIRFVVKK